RPRPARPPPGSPPPQTYPPSPADQPGPATQHSSAGTLRPLQLRPIRRDALLQKVHSRHAASNKPPLIPSCRLGRATSASSICTTLAPSIPSLATSSDISPGQRSLTL